MIPVSFDSVSDLLFKAFLHVDDLLPASLRRTLFFVQQNSRPCSRLSCSSYFSS
jgi:hypothetical protein